MHKLLLTLSAAMTLFIVACDKESSGTIFDFSNSLPMYVNLTKTSDTANTKPGKTVTFTLTMRTAAQQAVTVTYDVSGAISQSDQTISIDRNTLRTSGTIDIPADILPTPTDSAFATLTIKKASMEDWQPMTLGRYNDSANQKIVYRIKN